MDDNLANNSSLDPNAAPFQPFIPHLQPVLNNYHHYNNYIHPINQAQNQVNQQRVTFSQNNDNYNIQNQQHQPNESDYYIPKLQLSMRSAMAALDGIEPIPIMEKAITAKPMINEKPIMDNPKEHTIFYNTLHITAPRKESHEAAAGNDGGTYNDTDLLNLLIVGYCHNIEGVEMHMIPTDLFVLFIRFYGYEKDIKLIGSCLLEGKSAGFGVCNYSTKKNVYYIPSISNSKPMNSIVCTATNIKLPFHIINEYNIKCATKQENEINEFNRFNVLFLQKCLRRNTYTANTEYIAEFSAIVFNDNLAFELIFPQSSMFLAFELNFEPKPSVYSSKYGLLVSMPGALISFSLKAWKWRIIEQNKKLNIGKTGENAMCLLEKESKLFIYRRIGVGHPRDYYLYDLDTLTFENVPCLSYSCSKPTFCCDETVNQRIYALSSNKNDINAGSVSYFDLNKFEWIHNAFPKHRGMKQIWLGTDKNILYGACQSIRRCVFMLDLRVAKKWERVFSFRPFKGSHCNTYFKL